MPRSDGAANAGAADGPALLPAILLLTSFLPNLRAAIPRETYYFRDFTLTYFPLRSFFADEIHAGRWPFWNRFLHEGAPFLPVIYPAELVQLLWPGPAMVSWLLTLHFPIAALCCYGLARDLGATRWGAFASGAAYALGGFCLSCLNLHWFLEALALAPAVVVTVRRAIGRGGRWVAWAGLILALSVSTLAVEFAAQAFLAGCVLGLVAEPSRRGLRRLALVGALGSGLAALPIALMIGIIDETARGTGLPTLTALQNSLHPLALLQTLVPDLPGFVADPLEAWWGARLYAGGSPYFLTLYLGPVAVALALHGASAFTVGVRRGLMLLSALGLLYALGAQGGLAAAVHPLVPWFRFPVKALLTPYLCATLWVGAGLDRLRRGEGLTRLAAASAVPASLLVLLGLMVSLRRTAVAAWLDASPRSEALLAATVSRESALGLGFLLAMVGLVLAAKRRWIAASRSGAAVLVLLTLDLWRGGAGVNPQTSADFFEPAPGLLPLLGDLGGGRVFSLGVDASPAMDRMLSRHAPGVGRMSFLVSRRMLIPFTGLLDRVEVAEGSDRLSFIPERPQLPPSAYRPEAIARLLPRLRDEAVTRIVSLDPLSHEELRLRGSVPAGPEGMRIYVYDVHDPWPRAYLACRDGDPAGLSGTRGLTSDGVGAAACQGSVTRVALGRWETYDTVSVAPAFLVMRDNFTPSWAATVDGTAAPVVRVNGWQRAVSVPGGRHRVVLRYEPPGLSAGIAATALASVLWLFLLGKPALVDPGPEAVAV